MENTATVKTVSAAVHVLQVGSRQITLSVYRQLDWRPFDKIEPFGRVNVDNGRFVVGRDINDGSLVASSVTMFPKDDKDECELAVFRSLPLIVLAGLR